MNKKYYIDKTELHDADGLTEGHLWKRIFPELPDFFRSYLNYSVLDELGDGETAAETIPVAVRGYDYETIKEVQAELAEMTWAVKQGKLNIEDFLEDVWIVLVPEYQNLSPLEWLADLQNLLEKAIQERYGEEF
ncbi:hypothetical protein FAI41_02490 [Acetobacteraceae bacterium]|nr:hypothetical protein FAI41_02490 [Acetobacteraceae bacterium]